MLRKISLENYRSCVNTSVTFNPELSVLIGPNGSGKTSIMQGVMLLNKLSKGGVHRSPRIEAKNYIPPRIKATFDEGRTTIKLQASVDTFTDESNNDVVRTSKQEWSIQDGNGKRATFKLPMFGIESPLFLGVDAKNRTNYLAYFNYRISHVSDRRTKYSLPPEWGRTALLRMQNECQGMTHYGASQFTNPAPCPASFEIEREEGHSERPRLRGHAKFLYDMYEAKRSENEEYLQFIDVVGPGGLRLIDSLTFKEVATSSSEYSVRVGGKLEVRERFKLLVIPQFKIGKQRLSPNQLSEGTFKTLALLFHLITSDSKILLIEEPEVCIHHGLLSSILEIIKSSSKQKQIILSTHSAYVLDHVGAENVFRVSNIRPIGTVVHNITKAMTTKEIHALRTYLSSEGNLGDYWREGGIGDPE
jgi:ABC-type Mn2+/Zn2+ transport system ATPase subunit